MANEKKTKLPDHIQKFLKEYEVWYEAYIEHSLADEDDETGPQPPGPPPAPPKPGNG